MFQHACFTFFCLFADFQIIVGQMDAPYDFATNTKGERSDELSPGEIAGICFGVIAIMAAMLVTGLFCYYVRRKTLQDEYSNGSFLSPKSNFNEKRSGY